MSDTEADPAEAPPPPRAPVVACTRAGKTARRIHAVPVGSRVALCGIEAGAWRVVSGAAIECRTCLGKVDRQAGR